MPAPVVILGVNEMALAAARSLHRRHGIRVIALDLGLERRPPASYSNCLDYRRAPVVEQGEELCAYLRRLAEELSPTKAVLLPMRDAAVLFLHRFRARLAPDYRFCIWDSEVLHELGSKRGLRGVAARYDLPLPETLVPDGATDLEAHTRTMRFPLLVKPEYTPQWWTEVALGLGLGYKAIAVADVVELRDVLERSQRAGARVVVQHIIGGSDSDHWSYAAFVGPAGRTSAEILVRKLRVFPPRFGIGSYVSTEADDEILELGRAILRRLDFRGFASVQLKREGSGGRVYLIEINLRLPMWTELAIRAGADFPWHYYRAALGEPCSSAPATLGTRWMSVSLDWRAMHSYAREGAWTWPRWFAQLLARPAVPVFSWRDPLPALVSSGREIVSGANRWVRRTRPPTYRARRV